MPDELTLLPCANCGHDAGRIIANAGRAPFAECGHCGMRTANMATVAGAVTVWNARPVPSPEESRELLASRLIDAWCADKGKKIPWAKAVQIGAIVTKQSAEETERLLKLGDEDGSCGMCGRSDGVPQGLPR